MTIRGAAVARRPAASARRRRRSARPRPGGSCGSRQPKRSPDDSARRRRSRRAASDSQVSSSVRAASSRRFQSRGRRSVAGQSFGRSPAASRSARRSSAWRHRNSAGLAEVAGLVEHEERPGVEVVEGRSTGRGRRPDLGRVADVRRGCGDSSLAPPRWLRRRGPSSSRSRSLPAAPGSFAARAEARPQLAAPPAAARNSDAGRSTHAIDRAGRPLVGRVERAAASRSRRRTNSIRTGSVRRRREHVDDAAAARELAPPGDLERPARSRARAARGAARLADAGADLRARAAASGRSSGAIVCWISAWTLATRIRALPAPPGRERRHAGCGLVGDELAPLVGERRPRLEDGHGSRDRRPTRRAPRRRDRRSRSRARPSDPLAGHEREGRREVALRAMRHGGDTGVPAGVRAGAAIGPSRSRSVANAPMPAQERGNPARFGGAGSGPSEAVAAGAGGRRLGWRRRRRSAGRRWLRGARRRRLGVRAGAPSPSGRGAASAAARSAVRPRRARGFGRTFRQPVFVRRMPSRPGGPSTAPGAAPAVLVGRPQLERVEPGRGLVRALARPRLDGVGGGIEQLVEPLPLVGLELREHVVDEPRPALADADPEPAEAPRSRARR